MSTPSPGTPPELPVGISWPDRTQEWWETLTTNPGTAQWGPDEWETARETAILHAQLWAGDTSALNAYDKRNAKLRSMMSTGDKRAARPWTARDSRDLIDLHAKGVTLSRCAVMLDRAKATVSREAKNLGLSWDREQTKAATVARIADARAAKVDAELAELTLLRAAQEAELAVLNGTARWKTLIRGEGGAEAIVELDFVPPNDARTKASARSSMAAIINQLASATSGADAATTTSLIADMAAKFWGGDTDGVVTETGTVDPGSDGDSEPVARSDPSREDDR